MKSFARNKQSSKFDEALLDSSRVSNRGDTYYYSKSSKSSDMHFLRSIMMINQTVQHTPQKQHRLSDILNPESRSYKPNPYLRNSAPIVHANQEEFIERTIQKVPVMVEYGQKIEVESVKKEKVGLLGCVNLNKRTYNQNHPIARTQLFDVKMKDKYMQKERISSEIDESLPRRSSNNSDISEN